MKRFRVVVSEMGELGGSGVEKTIEGLGGMDFCGALLLAALQVKLEGEFVGRCVIEHDGPDGLERLG